MVKMEVRVDDNSDMEMIFGWPDAWRLRGLRNNGECAAGFPMQYGNAVSGFSAVYDIDEDGKLELIVAPSDFKVYVYDLDLQQYKVYYHLVQERLPR